MTDFTKQELKILDYAVYHLQNGLVQSVNIPVEISSLSEKLQSILKNYCEHKPNRAVKWDEFGTSIEWKCKNCGEFYR